MTDIRRLMPQKEATQVLIHVMEHLAECPIRTAEGFRNAVLNGSFCVNPVLGFQELADVQPLRNTMINAVSEGRMIDFGFIPNQVIKVEAVRSRPMFEAGEFDQPYETWLGVSRWEGGMNGYLFMSDPEFPGKVVSVELYGVQMPVLNDVILLYDIITLDISPEGSRVIPIKFTVPQSDEQLMARGANSHDPLVTMLRLLADASIPVIDRPAPERLNKARAKQGKHLIPAHTEVVTRDYVAAFDAVAAVRRGAGKGGHHASPIAHWRRSHHRHLSSGKVVPVRSSKVNWRDSDDLRRLFYRIKEKTP